MKYHVSAGSDEHRVERLPEAMRIDDREIPLDAVQLGRDEIHVRLGSRAYHVRGRRTAEGWLIAVGGIEIEVSVEDERTRAIRRITGGRAGAAIGHDLRAPMPGLVLEVLVEPGQRVEPGDPLVVVEAMKMENELRAEGGGIVAAVEARPGSTVERDDVLVRFDPEASS